jgi:glycine/D-amino acid oxidase-like deaminating enzyme
MVVDAVEESAQGCTVRTSDGVSITSEHAVIATQAPIVDPAFLANRCRPAQSYAIAVRVPGSVPAGMYLSCDAAVRSLRPGPGNGDVMVVGGEGHPMGDDAAGIERWETLARWARQWFGAVQVTHRWATHDLVPTDHVPFVGRLGPGANRRWVATGFAKWGMTNAFVAADLIDAGIDGRGVPWAAAFDSTRLAASVTTELPQLALSATKHLVADRVLRRSAPRCTHQGCVLRRDEALGTWDCPCHGSRFDDTGAVVQGPAIAPLDRPPPGRTPEESP